MFWMLYAFFWVIPRRLNFICRHFGTLCLPSALTGMCQKWLGLRMLGFRNTLSHLHRRVGIKND
jgi:hypothetical protein